MATILLLGPSLWESGRTSPGYSPMEMRRHLAEIFRNHGHKVILMEDEPDIESEDLVDKFLRLLREKGITATLVYWPAHAKMQTTYSELIMLRARMDVSKWPPIWVLHHVSVASIKRDRFDVKEAGSRSRYLTAVAKLGVCPLEWGSVEELEEQARLLSKEL